MKSIKKVNIIGIEILLQNIDIHHMFIKRTIKRIDIISFVSRVQMLEIESN